MKLKDQYKLHPVRRLDQTNYRKLTADSHVVSDSVVHWNSEEMNCEVVVRSPVIIYFQCASTFGYLNAAAAEIHKGDTYKTMRQLDGKTTCHGGINFFSIAFLIICHKDSRTNNHCKGKYNIVPVLFSFNLLTYSIFRLSKPN